MEKKISSLLPKALAAGALLAFAGSSWAQSPEVEQQKANAAKRDYQQYCASCHGLSGKGDGPVSQNSAVNAPAITGLKAANDGVYPVEDVIAVIDGVKDVATHGIRSMPVWGEAFYATPEGVGKRQANERIRALADHIGTLQD